MTKRTPDLRRERGPTSAGPRPTRARAARVAAGLLSLSVTSGLGACRDDDTGQRELAVFAASSLTDVFTTLEAGFEARHPDVNVRLTFAGSQVLRLQLEQGAQADLFASADAAHTQDLERKGLLEPPLTFARNRLVVVVPADNPARIERFEDLPRAERLVVGNDSVPVGRYTRDMLARARLALGEDFADAVAADVVSEENNVRLVRAKVELGEADAAVVYRTDALASGRVRAIEIPDAINVRASYPIARLTRGDADEQARWFLEYLAADEGRAILERHGFETGAP